MTRAASGRGTLPPTRTPSLRRRVAAAVLAVVAVLLVLVVLLVDVLLGARLRSDLDATLADRTAQAQQLVAAGAGPEELVARLSGGSIRVRVVTAGGRALGDPGLGPPGGSPPVAGPDRDGRGPGATPVGPRAGRPPVPPDAGSRSTELALPGGGRVQLVADSAESTGIRTGLRAVLAGSVLLTLLVALAAVAVVVRTALRPLDRMTALAHRITAGDRGARLRPDRPGTDLGAAAAAFDGMLDALEDAETRSRVETERTRRFLADAAHELRTPLAGIAAVAESLDRSDPADASPGRRERRLELLLGETRRAGRLVADMLDLARIDGGTALVPTDTDLAAIARAEAGRAAVLAPGLTVDADADAAVPVHADPDRVTRILANLLDNARRHTPEGGRIEVTADRSPDGTARVRVRNTGTPIPDADRDRVFDRLVRLQDARDRDSGGAGLGLPIARGLARAHGGELTCVPDTGGATFVLELPARGPGVGPATTR